MYVIRRESDGWYFTNQRHCTWHPDPDLAQTYLTPHPTALWELEGDVYSEDSEEREPWYNALPVILGLSLLSWVALYYLFILLVWLRHHV
jgi:hypothetical protein